MSRQISRLAFTQAGDDLRLALCGYVMCSKVVYSHARYQEPPDSLAKRCLFLLIGVVSSVLLFLDAPTVRTLLLLALIIWGFCRAYYFAFYVIEHYVDARFRFSGLVSFVAYAFRKRSSS